METTEGGVAKMAAPGKDLYEFLVEAELAHYYQAFRTDLKVTSVAQIKYVEEEDMADLGMSRPEARRLKKFFRRECPQGAFGKIKKILSVKGGEAGIMRSAGSESPGEKSPQHTVRMPTKHIIAVESISICKTLGIGEFGTVQQGIWTNEDGERIQVAIKKLSKEKMQAGTPDFLKEATIMHSIDQEHIVRLYGVVLDSDALMLVTELAPLRSLLECLKEPAMRGSFSVCVLCDFAAQVADGMAYLENKRLIHRDLAARNILVFTKDKVKISDFGLSRALGVGKDYYQTNFSVNLKLPIAWCAPECINYLKFTTASDIWAYGVTLWEMFSYGFQPWAAFTGQQILEAIDEPNMQRLEQPDCCPREHYAVMKKCWEHDPKRRPTFAEIHRMLPQIKPEQVQVTSESCQGARADFLQYKASDIITVLDKRPEAAPSLSIWKGVLDSGKVGLIDSSDSTPYIEIKAASPLRARIKLSRRDSSRKSMKSARKLRADMISRPQNDLRHTGHIGYDGAMFGDVAFIGNNYDKLPVKVVSPYKPQDDVMASTSTASQHLDDIDKSKIADSDVISTTSTFTATTSSMGPGYSQLSLASSQANSDTFTDVSSYQGDADSLYRTNGRASGGYEELADDLDDFKMPDISSSFSLDLGTSFMDEVMKAFSDVTDKDKTPTEERRPLPDPEDPPPLIHDQSEYGRTNGSSSFENYSITKVPDYMADYEQENGYHHQEEQQNFENAALDSSRSSDFAGSSRSSSNATIGSGSDDTPTHLEKKKSRPKLRIDDDDESIPPWDNKKQEGVRPLSAKEERTIDEAIAVATEFVNLSTSGQTTPKTPKTPKDKQSQGPEASPQDGKKSRGPETAEKPETLSGLKSVFGIKKRSPRSEGRVFSEEFSKSSSASREDLSPEAQEVYNVLVGQGLQRERVEDGAAGVEHRRNVRDRRVRRSLEHQRHSGELPSTLDVEAAKERNQNLRAPQGIPGRRTGLRDTSASDMDVNPLRRLRESNSFAPRVARPADSSERLPNGHNNTTPRSTSLDHIRRPNITAQTQLLARVKDTDTEADAPRTHKTSHSADELAAVAARGSGDARNPPVPPRKPLMTSTLNSKPRERKYALDTNGGGQDESAGSDQSSEPDSHTRPATLQLRDQSHESQSQGVNGGGEATSEEANQPPPPPRKSYAHLPPFAVKNVTCSAAEMGIGNANDTFWSKPVDFEALSEVDSINAPPQEGGLIPIRYKSPDNVGYEDLMEFVLDGSPAQEVMTENGEQEDPWWSGEQNVCDEIRLMRKVLSRDVTVEDCMMSLHETQWNVHAAIKYLKLKQLMSTKLGDMEACKSALIRFSWCVPEAADWMLSNPPDQNSPDIVEL